MPTQPVMVAAYLARMRVFKEKITLVPDALNAVLSWYGVTYVKKTVLPR